MDQSVGPNSALVVTRLNSYENHNQYMVCIRSYRPDWLLELFEKVVNTRCAQDRWVVMTLNHLLCWHVRKMP